MSGRIDLHVHSDKSSDGDFTPGELVGFAREHGMRAISIADHDTVAAYPEAVEAGGRAGLEVIPSMEVTSVFAGREFHILLPFVDWTAPAVRRIVDKQTECRKVETGERVEKIRRLGFDLTMDEIEAKSNGAAVLGVKIAQILLENPANERRPALAPFYRPENRSHAPYLFYKEYFAEGRPAYVPKRFIGSLEVLAAAPEAGSAPVLAHPGAYFQRTTADDARLLAENGLAGLEVYNFYHTGEQTAFYRDLAEELGLVATAGSDFHGRIKPHVAFGALAEGDYGMVERLRERRRGAS
jgi:predicted metal-dependent phosphoesterase TrpH